MKTKYPLDSLENIRSALRKRTVQTAIYKNQAEVGSRQTDELLAYIGFMTEDECMTFLNSVREAPFIPNINMMWTQQIVEYLMLDDKSVIRKYHGFTGAKELVEGSCKDGEVSYSTKYVQQHVDKAYWHMLPKGWAAKYYRPSQVLKLAVSCAQYIALNDFCKHIAEKLFIKAADLEDCLSPVTKIPPVLPDLPKVVKAKDKREIVLRNFPDGAHISIDVPKSEQPVNSKVVEIPKQRRNPVAAATPMFAAKETKGKEAKQKSREIDAIIMARYWGFGGSDTMRQLSELLSITEGAVRNRIHRIRQQNNQPPRRRRVMTPEFLESIKPRLACFGGTESETSLAKELGVHNGTVSKWVKKIRANMAAATN